MAEKHKNKKENSLNETDKEEQVNETKVLHNTTNPTPLTPNGEGPAVEVGAHIPDPFEPENLRLSQNFGESLGVKKVLITIPKKKPSKEWWIRVHPDPDFRIETAVLELKEDREIYLVDRFLWDELSMETTFSPRAIFTAINRQGILFLWPI